MKKIFILLPLLIFVTACDAPQRTRMFNTESSNLNNSDIPTGNFTSGSGDGSGNNKGNPPVSTPGFENCDLTQKYHSISTGYFGICQSSQDETLIMFNPSLTSDDRVCIIPTYKESNGSSTYIGNPQCTTTVSNKVVTGKLYKDRPGFTNYTLNGVMVMKIGLVPEYMGCMQAYVNWPRNMCPNGATNQDCLMALQNCPQGGQTANPYYPCNNKAQEFMGYMCNTFKSKYSNAYVDIRLK